MQDPGLVASIRPLIAILAGFGAVPLILLASHRPNIRESFTIIAAVVKAAVVLSMLPDVLSGSILETTLWEIFPGVSLAFRVDSLGIIFGIVASLLWVLTSFYSIGYVRGTDEHKQTRYFASFAVCVGSTLGIAFSANLLTFFVCFEALTLATYPLVIHKETAKAKYAARKYLAYTLPAGLALLFAIAATWHVSGQMDFVPGGFVESTMASPQTLRLIFVLFILGVGVKAGIMPLHSWLPSAMAAPTPVSALLHAVAVVKAGVFGVLRVTGYVFGPETVANLGVGVALAGLAALTLTVASLLAMRQTNLKRRLAYSTVGHLSYIILGAALLNTWSLQGATLHLMFHATMKITLFFCAGAIYVRTHHEDIRDMVGIGRQMPITMTAFAIASLGLAGVPGVNGFVSKWGLANGTVAADQGWMLILLVISGVLNAAYFFPIVHQAFFRANDEFRRFGEAHPLMVLPLSITAIVSLVLGVAPNLGAHAWDLATLTAEQVVSGGMR